MKAWRTWHRFVGLGIALPLLMVAVTGSILELRGEFEFIQAKAVKTVLNNSDDLLTLKEIEEKFKDTSIEQIIWKPSKVNLVVRLEGGMEHQLHPQTGEVLKSAMRRTGLLIDLHQGSWMGAWGQYGIHFVTGLGLIFLIISGVILYPFKRKNR